MAITTKEIDPHPPGLKLRPVALDPENNGHLVIGVKFGSEPYDLEVEVHLRSKACNFERRHICYTTLFLHPDRDEVIGFYSINSHTLELTDEFREEFQLSKRQAPGFDLKVQVCYLMAFGVNVDWQKKGYAKQIFRHLVEAMMTGVWRPPYIYLKVWRDNSDGCWFWNDFEFVNFEEETAYRAIDKVKGIRYRMATWLGD